MFSQSKKIISFSLAFLAIDALFALTVSFLDMNKATALTFLILCAAIALSLIFVILRQVVYISRLKEFLGTLPEAPEHYFRKSSYRLKDRFYWFTDYFLDLKILKRFSYEKISSITVRTDFIGISSGSFPHIGPSLHISEWYRLTIRCGSRSVIIRIPDNDRLCRCIIKQFKKRNKNINVYNES